MKKLFSILSVAALISLGLTSCNKDDSGKKDPDPKVSSVDFVFLAAIFPDQDKYLDQSFEIVVDGKSTTITISQMTEIAESKEYSLFFGKIRDGIKLFPDPITSTFKVYKYPIGALTQGHTVKGGTKTYQIKSGRPSTAEFDVLDAYGFHGSGSTNYAKYNTVIYGGVPNTDSALQKHCSILTKSMDFTATVQ